jgi:hypothetical protein
VSETVKHLQAVPDRFIGPFTFDVANKTDAAAVLFEPRVIKADSFLSVYHRYSFITDKKDETLPPRPWSDPRNIISTQVW